jgi:MFS family permease
MLAAIAIFILGSIACALAPTMLGLILARFLQGLGGGGLISLAQTITADAVSPKERSRYMGYFGVVFASSSIAGPVLGGVISQSVGWAAIFWINVPLGLLALVMTSNALKKLPRHERRHSLDYLGALLLVAAAVLLLLALSWGGVVYPWASPPILGLIGGSAIAWIAFALHLTRAEEPFLPLGVLADRVVAMATLSGFFGIGTMVGLTIYMPLFFQSVLHMSAAGSGFALILLSAGTVAGAQTSGFLMARLRHYKIAPIVGLVASMLAMITLTLFAADLSLTAIQAVLAVAGAGLGTLFPVTVVVVQNAVQPHHMGTATGTLNFMRALGSAILVAVFGAIFLAGIGATGGASVETLIADAMSKGVSLAGPFQGVFAAGTVCVFITFVLMLLIEERPLRGGSRPPATVTE